MWHSSPYYQYFVIPLWQVKIRLIKGSPDFTGWYGMSILTYCKAHLVNGLLV